MEWSCDALWLIQFLVMSRKKSVESYTIYHSSANGYFLSRKVLRVSKTVFHVYKIQVSVNKDTQTHSNKVQRFCQNQWAWLKVHKEWTSVHKIGCKVCSLQQLGSAALRTSCQFCAEVLTLRNLRRSCMLVSKYEFLIILAVHPFINPPTKPADEKGIFTRAVDYTHILLTQALLFNYFMACSALKVIRKVRKSSCSELTNYHKRLWCFMSSWSKPKWIQNAYFKKKN